jgi:hypothetical protein
MPDLILKRIVASHAVAKQQTPQGIRKVPGKIVVDLEDEGGFVTRLLLTKDEAAQLPVDSDLEITLRIVGNGQPAAPQPEGAGGSAPGGQAADGDGGATAGNAAASSVVPMTAKRSHHRPKAPKV